MVITTGGILGLAEWIIDCTHVLLIHSQAQTKAQAWKVVHYFWWWCPYVQNKTKNKPIKELNHFSSQCFGWCLGVDHCTTQVF